MLFDSHAHLTSPQVFPEVDQVLARAKAQQVTRIVNICTSIETLEKGLELSKQYPWVYNAAATTPHDVEKEGAEVFSVMAASARSGKLVAVGETGLDYYYTHSNKEIQKEFLKKYLHLALECHLPIIIHCREAFHDLFEILDVEYQVNQKLAPGVLHCFTGTCEEAVQVLERGWFLSLSGIVTFKKSEQLREVAKNVPLEQLLIETDTPYLAPQSHRGKMNEPSFLPEVAAVVASVKNISVEEVINATTRNAEQFFGTLTAH